MPVKVRILKANLAKAGFLMKPSRGKGSHTYWVHPNLPGVAVTISGNDSDDAFKYQIKEVTNAISRVQ